MGEGLTRVARAFSWRLLWWVLPGVAGGLALLVTTVSSEPSRPGPIAVAKANQLLAAFSRAGLPPPSTVDRLWTVLGEDGGVVCETAASPSHLGYLAELPAPLPVSYVFGSLVLVVEVYCPDRLPALALLAGRTAVRHV